VEHPDRFLENLLGSLDLQDHLKAIFDAGVA
jgi:hypothetical protein